MRLSLTHRGPFWRRCSRCSSERAPVTFDPLPDASVAVFFLAAFYVGRTRWLLPLLIVAAVLCDWITITGRGEDFWTHHCVSIAYWFLVPAYVSLWLAGRCSNAASLRQCREYCWPAQLCSLHSPRGCFSRMVVSTG